MKKLFRSLLVGFVAMGALSACDAIKPKEITNPQDVEALLNEAAKTFTAENIVCLDLKSKEPLTEALGEVVAVYKDPEDGKFYSQQVDASVGAKDPDATYNSFYEQCKQYSLADLRTQFGDIKALRDEAVRIATELAEGEYEGFKLGEVRLRSTKQGQIERSLVLTSTKTGESPKMQGRRTMVTNYYEFEFKIHEDNTLEYVD